MLRFAKLLPAALALTAAFAVPLAAAGSGPDWAEAGKSFAVGKKAGTTPQTTGEYAMCAGWWSAWGNALAAKRLTAAELKSLPAEVQAKAAKAAAASWKRKAGKDGAADIAASEGEAAAAIDKAVGGDHGAAASLLEMLGICHG